MDNPHAKLATQMYQACLENDLFPVLEGILSQKRRTLLFLYYGILLHFARYDYLSILIIYTINFCSLLVEFCQDDIRQTLIH